MNNPRLVRQAATTLLLLGMILRANAGELLHSENAWARAAPPGASVMAGYVTLSNPGDSPVVIEGASGDDFSSVEIHRTEIENGMARMLPVDSFEIPAGGEFSLAPGGHHFMLFNPSRNLAAGDGTTLYLHIRNGPCFRLDMPVRRMPAQ